MRRQLNVSITAVACAALAVVVSLCLSASALAVTPAVGWHVESVHGPTNLAPGGKGQYNLFVMNRGAVASNGTTITLTDALPAGVTPTGTPSGEGWTCVSSPGAGDTVETCTTTQVVAPDSFIGEQGIAIPMSVSAGVVKGSTLTNSVSVSGGGAPGSASASEQAKVSTAPVSFGIQSFSAEAYGPAGEVFTQAGGHPYAATATWNFNTATSTTFEPPREVIVDPENLKDNEVELPPGFIGNPDATPKCFTLGGCPASTIVGTVSLALQGFGVAGLETEPVYNMVPPKGMAAQFYFPTLSPTVIIDARVRSNGNYGLTAYSEDISERYRVDSVAFTFWGTPAAASHEALRHGNVRHAVGEPSNGPETPFLSYPTDCSSEASSPPVTTLKVDSWQHPGAFTEKSFAAPPVTGCSALTFDPQIAFAPESSQAGQPTGFGFDLKVPQSEVTGALATPELKDTTVSLPAGMGVSPSASVGLTACSEEAFYGSASERAALDAQPGKCPLSSQVADAAIWTPLLSTQPEVLRTATTVGSTYELECATGTWSGHPTGYAFHWLRDGVPIAGAEGTGYVPQAADAGKALQCEVTASNAGGSTTAVSTNDTIAPFPSPLEPQAVVLPKSEGGTHIGDEDTCTTGYWSESPTGYSYRWLRDGTVIAGAEGNTYALSGEDEGQSVQCEVLASNVSGSAVALSVATVAGSAPAMPPPLIEPPLKGRVYVGEPECSPCSAAQVAEGKLVRLYIEAEGVGVRVKLPGHVSANPSTGQLTATFDENPQLPFEELQLNFKNGPRAPLANPQKCGTYLSTSDLEPWSAPELQDALPSSAFDVDFNGSGAGCPSSLPFSPVVVAGTSSQAASQSSNFALTFSRPDPKNETEERSEQDFYGAQVHLPPGLLGKIAGVPECPEPQASEGTCASESQIGTTSVAAGPGSHPLQLQGKVFFTTGYKGAPFGLSIVVPAEAGPFRLAGTTGLGTVVVRAAINIDPNTAALTITSDPFPQILDGVILRLHSATVEVNRPGFMFNSTNCAQQQITTTLTGAEGAKDEASVPYAASGCAALPFAPSFTVSTQAKTSKADGASLTVNVAYPHSNEANIKMVKVELPEQLPSRLTTLQKACLAATFEANPANCPAASVVGSVKASTPVLPVPLEGPVYFVSHGGEAFPSLIVVLQGDGVRIDLTGATFISKAGITSSTFKTVPDAPVSSFELTLPEGPYSALAANGNLCVPTKTVTVKEQVTRKGPHGRSRRVTVKVKKQEPETLLMPTTIEGQNGKVIKQQTKIAVTGCPKAKKVTKAKAKTKTKTKAKAKAKAKKAAAARKRSGR